MRVTLAIVLLLGLLAPAVALADRCRPDAAAATLLPPNDAPVHGLAAIRPRYERLFAEFDPAIEGHVDEVCVEGRQAVVRGRNGGRLVPRGPGAPRNLSDVWLMVLRRGADGAWRISHLMWHPAPASDGQ
jgi:ketosteroid isomerase-like protein